MELTVGRVVKAHGIIGEVVVEVHTDDPASRFAPGSTLRARRSAGHEHSYVIDTVRDHGARLLVRLAGVTDRDAAEQLRGALFVIDTDELPPIAEPDTYYDHQLAGLRVQTMSGQAIGTVTEVLHTAVGELLAVRRNDAGELLVPFVAAIVTGVSLDEQSLEIDPPDGLLELE